jgi:hypothetical protein
MEEEVASKELRFAIVGTRREFTWTGLYVSGGQIDIVIANLILEFSWDRRARDHGD